MLLQSESNGREFKLSELENKACCGICEGLLVFDYNPELKANVAECCHIFYELHPTKARLVIQHVK